MKDLGLSRLDAIKTGAGAHAFRSAGDGRHVYVSNRVANSISKIDTSAMEAAAKEITVLLVCAAGAARCKQ